ncbi:MAG: DNA repair protein RecO [Candidatus Cloacimonetes bacterium]|nr:DNA repair protein RecO [Candidatus Cloacimonadota bacterium]
MTEKSREITLEGIILRKVPFRETSMILDIFTNKLGIIPVMAKGIRKEKSKNTGLIELLNELDLVLYKNPSSDWFIYKSAALTRAHLFEVDFKTGVLMQAAAEIYRQLIIPGEDAEKLYELFLKYLQFIPQVKKNGIAIFWRFLLRLFRLIGIEFNSTTCINCGNKGNFIAYFPQKHGFICKKCFRPVYDDLVFEISGEQAELFSNINHIGNMLDEIEISEENINQLNRIFLTHLSEHFHKKFHLKSLDIYKV